MITSACRECGIALACTSYTTTDPIDRTKLCVGCHGKNMKDKQFRSTIREEVRNVLVEAGLIKDGGLK